MGADGTSPVLDPARLEALGYDLVLYPLAATQATLVGTFEHLRRLKDDESGVIGELDDAVESLPVEDLHDFAGFPEVVAWEERYIPETEERKYEARSASTSGTTSESAVMGSEAT